MPDGDSTFELIKTIIKNEKFALRKDPFNFAEFA